MAVHIPTLAVPYQAPRRDDSRPRPQAPICHARFGGFATNVMTPATCGIDRVSGPSGIFVHNDPDVRRTPLDRQRARQKTPPSHRLPLEDHGTPARAADSSFPARFGEDAMRRGYLLPAETASLRDTSLHGDRAVPQERNRMMARTKRSRRSYGADEWTRNWVRVSPALL